MTRAEERSPLPAVTWAYYLRAWHTIEDYRWPSATFTCGLYFDGRDRSISDRIETRAGEVEASGKPRCSACLTKSRDNRTSGPGLAGFAGSEARKRWLAGEDGQSDTGISGFLKKEGETDV